MRKESFEIYKEILKSNNPVAVVNKIDNIEIAKDIIALFCTDRNLLIIENTIINGGKRYVKDFSD